MPIYGDEIDRRAWLRLLAALALRFDWRCEAWTLMTNHFHLLVETTQANLGAGMQLLNGNYARGFNRRYGRVNHLFGERYSSVPVLDDLQFLSVARYIPLNAPLAGLCDRPEEWPWCSFAATIGLTAAPSFLHPDAILRLFGSGANARRRYAEFVTAALEALEPAGR
jgi:REP element-mobilizing transposase RayT